MNSDEILEQLYAARRQLTILIAQTAIEKVDPTELATLVAQRDRVVWLTNRILVANLSASLADTETAVKNLAAATTKLEKLKSTAEDITKAIEITKTIVTVVTVVLGAV